MFSSASLRSLEAAAYRSWPSRELELYDGWHLRYSDGFSRRGNSVYPLGPSQVALSSKLAYCDDWFRRRNLELVFRQTPETEPGLDQALDEAGFTVEGRTNVMVASLPGQEGRVVDAPFSEEWAEAASSLWGIDESSAPAWRGILNRIELPASYVMGSGADGPVGVGVGVVDGDWLGLFELIVAKAVRRQGYGARLLAELMHWGRACGATRTYLQVVEDNTAAISLYESAGFEEAYTYWYRRSPVR